MASVCSSSRLPPARSAARQARIHVEHADASRWPSESTLVASPCPGAHAHQRHADHAAQFQVGDAVLRAGVVAGPRDRSSWRAVRAGARSARRITSRGTRRSLSSRLVPARWRATRVSRPAPPDVRSSRKPRSAPVMASAVSTTDASTSSTENELCSVRARSRMARSLPRLPPTPGPAVFSGDAHLFHQPLQLRAIQREDQLVGILRAEFDACRNCAAAARVTRWPLTNVPWRLPQSSSQYCAVFEHDPRVRARSPAVANDQVVLRLPADAERQRLDGDARAVPVGVHHHQRSAAAAVAVVEA